MVDIPVADGPEAPPIGKAPATMAVSETDDEVVLEVSGFEADGRRLRTKMSPEAAMKAARAMAEAARNVMRRQASAGAHGKLAERNRG